MTDNENQPTPETQDAGEESKQRQKNKKRMLVPPEMWADVQRISKALKETDRKPQIQIAKIVRICGLEFADAVLAETLEIEESGGMMLMDGSRRRTTGGIFFYLCRQKLEPPIRDQIFQYRWSRVPDDPNTVDQPELDWDERTEIFPVLMEAPGQTDNIKATIIGRPDSVEAQEDVVVLTITHDAPLPTVPRGVPVPAEATGPHTVYVSPEQWEKVEATLKKDTVKLHIEGIFNCDEQGKVTFYATDVTSKQYNLPKKSAQEKSEADTEAE
ncbi:MAG: hypothetical protein K8L99_20580 [Anaerolineae bacterium]|nr:hypothetical protein [Anaerolineae bacterium]